MSPIFKDPVHVLKYRLIMIAIFIGKQWNVVANGMMCTLIKTSIMDYLPYSVYLNTHD